ncbi:MAG: MOP flippase family protein [Planctomycetota bacterium]|jgi:PST family polysaccharide transporter
MPPTIALTATPDDLRRRTVSAAAWSLAVQAALVAINFAVVVTLARLLAPAAFGLLAMTVVITGFAALFSDVGFGAALIQRPQLQERHRSSVFWLSIAIGCGLTVTIAAASPLVAWFFKEPMLVGMTMLASLNFLVTSLTVVHRAVLKRALRFRPLVTIDLAAVTGSGLLAILLALLGAGAWSLIAWPVAASVIRTALLWRAAGWWPSRTWDRDAIRELFGFGRNLLGFNIVNYWIRNTDKLLVGRFLAAGALGLYTRSYALMLMPLGLITQALGNVMFPAMAEIQHERARVARIYLRTTRAVSLVSFPLMIGLFVVADDFVAALFGPKWSDMVGIVQLFCLAGVLESIGSLNGNLYMSQGRSDLMFRVGAIVGLLGVAAMAVGLMWGLIGVALAYTVYATLAAWPQMHIAVGLVGLRVRDVVRGLAGTFGCALLMGVAVQAIGLFMGPQWPPAWSLAVKVTLGVSVYGLLVVGLRSQAYRDVREVAANQIGYPHSEHAGDAPTA